MSSVCREENGRLDRWLVAFACLVLGATVGASFMAYVQSRNTATRLDEQRKILSELYRAVDVLDADVTALSRLLVENHHGRSTPQASPP